jgi:hypothetical protein
MGRTNVDMGAASSIRRCVRFNRAVGTLMLDLYCIISIYLPSLDKSLSKNLASPLLHMQDLCEGIPVSPT